MHISRSVRRSQQVVVADAEAARQRLIAHGVQASDVDVQPCEARSSPSATPTATSRRCSSYPRDRRMPSYAPGIGQQHRTARTRHSITKANLGWKAP